jgi:hypothetical protein
MQCGFNHTALRNAMPPCIGPHDPVTGALQAVADVECNAPLVYALCARVL